MGSSSTGAELEPLLQTQQPTTFVGSEMSRHAKSRIGIRIGLSRRETAYYDTVLGIESDLNITSTTININEGSNGRRAWYPNYSTIDWIHDSLKERARIRRLRSHGTIFENILDSAQGWLLLLATGVLVGVIAAFIDMAETFLQQTREGYCAEWSGSHSPSNASSWCVRWVPWSAILGHEFGLPVYAASAVIFAVIAVIVTNLSVVSRPSEIPGGKPSLSYQASGGGIDEVKTILGGFVIRGFLGFNTFLTKVVGLIFAIASGLTLGQQGPLVHIACCIGNIFARFFPKYAKNEGKRREMLSAASAAGVSVAFAAPIGGVLFSLEEVSYYFPMKTLWRTFFCSCMAAVTLKVLNPLGSGKLVKFQVTYSRDWVDFEILPFILLGVAGVSVSKTLFSFFFFCILGIYGAVFTRISNIWSGFKRRYFPINPILEVAVVAFITSIVNHRLRFTRLSVSEIVGVLFSECKTNDPTDLYGLCNTFDDPFGVISILLSLLGAKLVLNLFTNGLRVPGGFYAASMLIGACIGRIVGIVVLQLQQKYPGVFILSQCMETNTCVTPAIYGLVGAAAALGGMSRSTVSIAVIMVEITGALKLVLPIMIAVMFAKWTADSISKNELDPSYPYLDHKSEHHPPRGTIRPVASAADVSESSSDFQANHEYTWEEVGEKLNSMTSIDDSGFAVLEGQKLVGYIAYQELKYAAAAAQKTNSFNSTCFFRHSDSDSDDQQQQQQSKDFSSECTDLTAWMDQAPLTVSSRASMDLVVELFMKLGCKVVCVVDTGGRFNGVLTKKRVIAWLKE
ncbi:hypothetical protein HK100_008746 [Physocladia obscura]|uniref:Chloride channel protein n=1 Tax=Physocladia obscura TaxID=109957 RepID=A0AAD5XEI0_9FUNG|nr:hypothetical protein HK100_008746 [Physocladia obscura]